MVKPKARIRKMAPGLYVISMSDGAEVILSKGGVSVKRGVGSFTAKDAKAPRGHSKTWTGAAIMKSVRAAIKEEAEFWGAATKANPDLAPLAEAMGPPRKPVITESYVEFRVSGMDMAGLTDADKWMDKFCKDRGLDKKKLRVEGNNDVPWLRYYFKKTKTLSHKMEGEADYKTDSLRVHVDQQSNGDQKVRIEVEITSPKGSKMAEGLCNYLVKAQEVLSSFDSNDPMWEGIDLRAVARGGIVAKAVARALGKALGMKIGTLPRLTEVWWPKTTERRKE